MKKITLILTLAITIAFSSSSVFSETTMDLYNQVADISSHKSCKTQLIESFKELPTGEISKETTCGIQKLPCLTFKGLEYCTVMSPKTGKFWLDRNLGATQVCESSTDRACFGHLYQWGRNDDGHELRTSSVTTTRFSDITPESDKFYVRSGTDPHNVDWLQIPTPFTHKDLEDSGAKRAATWRDGGVNDICPTGFSVPTSDALIADTVHKNTAFDDVSEGKNDILNLATAFSSFLKIPTAGLRNHVDGGRIIEEDSSTALWSRGYSANTLVSTGHFTLIDEHTAISASGLLSAATGASVRCIRN